MWLLIYAYVDYGPLRVLTVVRLCFVKFVYIFHFYILPL